MSRRLESVDLLRGLLMVLMAIDHARDYFSAVSGVDPTNPLHSWPALFATRWVTHLCAPGFIALAGASVYLQRERGKSAGAMSKLLVTRGLWLILVEVTVISFGWSFSLAPGLIVFWSIGVSMIFLATLQRLSVRAIGAIGAAIVLLHNLLDGIHPARGALGNLWMLVHQQGPILMNGRPVLMVLYPVVPWIGVIALGYAFGPVLLRQPPHRRKVAAWTGTALLTLFAVLRVTRGYGDPITFQHLASRTQTAMSFLQVEKYPPSLHYLLATLGVCLLLYALLDYAVSRNWLRSVRGVVEVFGRVPFFYYVVHIYVLHAAALLLTAAKGMNWRFWLQPAAVFIDHLEGWGFGLPGVYLAWLLVVAALYFPCRWFADVKARRRDWWLSYL